MPNPAVPETRRCRSLTVDGVQCRQRSLLGDKFCVKHARFRHPISFRNGEAALPLLEDLNTIQVVASQVAQGLLAGTLEDRTARTILYACQIAALGCTRPARVPASREIPELLQPVADITLDDNGQPLGPDVPWVDPDATHPVPIDWDKLVERNETHYCQSGNLWCFGTHMINCCDDCRKRRLAVLAEAEINRQHFSHEQRSEVALNEMIERLRREAAELPNLPPPSDEAAAAAAAPAPSVLNLNAAAEPQPVTLNLQPVTSNRTPQPATCNIKPSPELCAPSSAPISEPSSSTAPGICGGFQRTCGSDSSRRRSSGTTYAAAFKEPAASDTIDPARRKPQCCSAQRFSAGNARPKTRESRRDDAESPGAPPLSRPRPQAGPQPRISTKAQSGKDDAESPGARPCRAPGHRLGCNSESPRRRNPVLVSGHDFSRADMPHKKGGL